MFVPLLSAAAEAASESSVTLLDIIIILGAVGCVVFVYIYMTRKPPPVIGNKGGYGKPLLNPGKTSGQSQSNGPKAEAKGPPITILFGSQSGTAETFAYDLAKEAKNNGFRPKVVDLEEYEHEDELANEKFVCFLMATFGEGEPTDSAQKFFSWLMNNEREPTQFDGLDYAVFGLGNRQYEHFCLVGRKVSSRMSELGATELLDHGEGDDDGSLEDDYAAWRVKFWEAAKAKFGGSDDNGPAKFEPTTVLNWVESKEAAPSVAAAAEETKSADEDDFVIVDSPRVPAVFIDPKHKGGYALVTDNYELRQDPASGSTRHIEIDISDMPFAYHTADNLGVFPRNDYKLVAKVARRLGLSLKSQFTLSAKNGGRKLPIPSPCTVHDALLWYCDLTSIPKRTLLETFMQYATDAADKAKLSQYVHDGKAAYLEDKKNLLDVLEEVPSVKIPFGDFLEMCPKLIPRYYTISSSARHRPDRLTVTVVVTRGDKPRGRVHQGVCSTYLSHLVPNKDRVAVFCRDSTFRPTWEIQGPASKNPPAPPAGIRPDAPPMILVGPGTGVAPFRGFLQEAALLAKAGVKVPELMLFFGCQRQTKDFLYKDELTQHHDQGLVKLFTAFSRETNQKVYVQHKMLEQGAAIWDLINNKGGSVFICGATAMGTDVRSVLVEIFQKFGEKSQQQASDLFRSLQAQKRLVQELWD